MKKFFILKNGTAQGPFTEAELIAHSVNFSTMLCEEGMNKWRMASEVKELKDLQKNLQPDIVSYYLLEENTSIGPFTEFELGTKKLNFDTKVCIAGTNEWKLISEVESLSQLTRSITPAPPNYRDENRRFRLYFNLLLLALTISVVINIKLWIGA